MHCSTASCTREGYGMDTGKRTRGRRREARSPHGRWPQAASGGGSISPTADEIGPLSRVIATHNPPIHGQKHGRQRRKRRRQKTAAEGGGRISIIGSSCTLVSGASGWHLRAPPRGTHSRCTDRDGHVDGHAVRSLMARGGEGRRANRITWDGRIRPVGWICGITARVSR